MRTHVGRYRISSQIGAGGMGVVYAAEDEALDRRVAVKILNASALGEGAARFWREARAAAALNHPNICQVYDIGVDGDDLFIVMELLEGESLAQHMERGALPTGDAVQIALGILAACEALHTRSLVHRDIKPANVFLTPHAVKLLDFGLARPMNVRPEERDTTLSVVTKRGALVGTPRYMSPEQLTNDTIDARSDLFAVGTVLYEMISGRAAFAGSSTIQTYHSVMFEQPPRLTGPDPVPSLDAIVRRAIAKSPAARFESAADMAAELRRLFSKTDTIAPMQALVSTRLIVLPFRVLRPNAEVDFLGFSLADAITASLSGLRSLTVRSSMTGARYASETDVKKVAGETDVDFVLTGSVLAAGDQIRVSTQLVEAATGSITWSQTSQASLRDVFALQDEVVQRVAGSLPISFTGREREMLRRDVPANPTAYDFYLRANQAACFYEQMTVARDLYLRSVEADPEYAPAWARLGRCYRVLAKFGPDPEDFVLADKAFQRALELNPDLPLAHNLLAQLDADMGRAEDAAVRLVNRAKTRGGDPELFSGLVHVCRFCGMLEASVSAHEHAHRLDPHVQTSITNTYLAMGDYERALETSRGVHHYVGPLALVMLGRNEEAARLSRELDLSSAARSLARYYYASVRALADGDIERALALSREGVLMMSRGPEELYYFARHLSFLGKADEALAVLSRSVEQGFFCYPAFVADPWLAPLREYSWFQSLLRTARERHEQAARRFLEAGGERLLGLRIEAAAAAR